MTSWFNVRLAFADGARVDALAVLSEGCVSIEDVRAQPALSLGDLTVLAEWLAGPLSEACGLDTEPAEDTAERMAVDTAAEPAQEQARESAERPAQGPAQEQAWESAQGPAQEQAWESAQGPAQEQAQGPARESAEESVEEPAVEPAGSCEVASGSEEVDPAGPRRGRPAWPRGIEGRRLVAREYRAAQKEGVDPVLAVMCATGRSRRRSLRLIAQARDAGFLAPRHARR
ncbi:DUF6214 family protein [Streptomyces sp. NPDC002928]|uniref:DUF6214 family protein n=1 Tax=Streptomyces sp. NPDC002928 TaxID=3154440 RepID=UPI0033BD3987